MQLHDHPLMSYHTTRNWPPVWIDKFTENKTLKGERGIEIQLGTISFTCISLMKINLIWVVLSLMTLALCVDRQSAKNTYQHQSKRSAASICRILSNHRIVVHIETLNARPGTILSLTLGLLNESSTLST
jgi:hypothetical protein